jgi:predicted O-methyltransferase YrrM
MVEIVISNKILDKFTMKNSEYLFHQDNYLDLSGTHEYRLYSYLSTFFYNTTILDIGTSFGRSAVALSHNDTNKVITYDIHNWIQNDYHKVYSKSNIEFRLKNVIDDLTEDFVSNCRLIIIDIDHYGTTEKAIMDKLVECKFSGIIILDDLYHPQQDMYEAMQKLWKNINIPKFDFTKYGHWSGTGLVLMNAGDIHLTVTLS